jgi:hypothetical protein
MVLDVDTKLTSVHSAHLSLSNGLSLSSSCFCKYLL